MRSGRKEYRHKWKKGAGFVFCIIILFVVMPPTMATEHQADSNVFGPSLQLILAFHKAGMRSDFLPSTDEIDVTIRFKQPPTPQIESLLEDIGIKFSRSDDKIYLAGNIAIARAPLNILETLAGIEEIERIETSWTPVFYQPLNQSIPELQADQVWEEVTDPGGNPVDGTSMRVAIFDTGIDVYHPSFFFPMDIELNWLDVNGNHQFDPGMDGVDKNSNGMLDSGEILSYRESKILDANNYEPNPINTFTADVDWLFNDANNNGFRDFGVEQGYGEHDPTYGERLYVVKDTNGNNRLDVGEKLIPLGLSKIYANYDATNEFKRGEDLLDTPSDISGHGTAVASVIAGEMPRYRRFVGVAPGAEIMVGLFSTTDDYPRLLQWADESAARVFCHQMVVPHLQYNDGSSNLEALIDNYHNRQIPQVFPSGNFASGGKHAHGSVPAYSSVNLQIYSPPGWQSPLDPGLVLIVTFLWTSPSNMMNFQITAPNGWSRELDLQNNPQQWNGYIIYSFSQVSSRNTSMVVLYVQKDVNPTVVGNWTFSVQNDAGSAEPFEAWVTDQHAVFEGATVFTNYQDPSGSVCWPATADGADVAGSYSTRAFPGQLSDFSSQGPRIDGFMSLDFACPGHYDVISACSHSILESQYRYTVGGGTSFAAAHLAGAYTLMFQKYPQRSLVDIAIMMQQTAKSDAFTGITPNHAWGYGKLQIRDAISYAEVTATPTRTRTATRTRTPTATATGQATFTPSRTPTKTPPPATPTRTPTNTGAATFTPSRTPTPTTPAFTGPVVMLGGYWETRVNAASGGVVHLRALILDFIEPGVEEAYIFYMGQNTQIKLKDNGFSDDFGRDDDIYGVFFDFGGGLSPVRALLEIGAVDYEATWSELWPYMNVKN